MWDLEIVYIISLATYVIVFWLGLFSEWPKFVLRGGLGLRPIVDRLSCRTRGFAAAGIRLVPASSWVRCLWLISSLCLWLISSLCLWLICWLCLLSDQDKVFTSRIMDLLFNREYFIMFTKEIMKNKMSHSTNCY